MKFFAEFLLVTSLAGLASAGFWSDIIRAVINTNRYTNLFEELGNTTNELLNDDGDAATFICDILRGDVPDAIEGLGSAIESDVVDDFEALTSFVESLPTLVPEVLSDIVQGGEDAVSIVEELVTNPGAAITVIEDGVESVFSDVVAVVTSVYGDVTYFFGCDLGGDCPSSTSNQILASCSAVLAGAPPASASGAQSTIHPAASSAAAPGSGAAPGQASQTAANEGAANPTATQGQAGGNTNSNGADILGPGCTGLVLVGLVGLVFFL